MTFSRNARVCLLLLASVGVPALALAASYNKTPASTVASASAICSNGSPTTGDMCWITDGNGAGDCTQGGGSTEVMCVYNGSAWVSMPSGATVEDGSSLTLSASGPAIHLKDSDATDTDNNASLSGNLTDTGSGSEDMDVTLSVQVAGTATTKLSIDADDEIALTPQNELQVINNATGNVDLSLRDYADAADDDMSHSTLRANCTDATSGAEDCDFSILIPESGNAIESRFSIDADGGITIGSSNNDTITLTTDGTGTAEVVLPNDAVSTAEILDDTIDFSNISDSSAIDADTTFTAADGITLTLTPTMDDTTGAFFTFNADQADDGDGSDNHAVMKMDITSESGDANDTLVGLDIEYEEGTANTIFDAAIAIDNEETTASTLTDAIIITSSGVSGGVVDAIDVSASNITNAINIGSNPILGGNSDTLLIGETDDTFDFTREDAGTVTLTSSDNDGTAALTVDPGGDATLTLGSASDTVTVAATSGLTLANSESLNTGSDAVFDFTRNTAGAVTLTASDDDATAAIVLDAGGAASVTIGSADVTAINLIPDADVQIQNGATGNVDLTFHDYADTADDDQAHALIRANCTTATSAGEDCDLSFGVAEGGAAAEVRLAIDADGGITVGSANNNSITFTTDGTGTSELTFPADSIEGADIADSVCTSVVAVAFDPTEAQGTTDFVNLLDSTFSTTEGDEDVFTVPVAVRVSNLYAETDNDPGTGDDWTIVIREDGGDTAVTCMISDTNTSCTDTSNTDAIAAGAKLNISASSADGAGDPDAAGEMLVSFCITPD